MNYNSHYNPNDGVDEIKIGRLKKIEILVHNYSTSVVVDTMNGFDRFWMRRLVKRYKLKWKPRGHIFPQLCAMMIVLVHLAKYFSIL